jgi:hypothetical protein
MKYKIRLLVCSASALMLFGCYKIEKLEDGKYARINTITGDTVVVNKDGTAIVVEPKPLPPPRPNVIYSINSRDDLLKARTLTTFVPESDDNLKIEFKYRYRESLLEYIITVNTENAAFISDALRKENNSLKILLCDPEQFEITSISFTAFLRVTSKGEVIDLSLQGSENMSLSDFKRISLVSPRWSYTPEFKSELADWVLKTNAKKPEPAPDVETPAASGASGTKN